MKRIASLSITLFLIVIVNALIASAFSQGIAQELPTSAAMARYFVLRSAVATAIVPHL